MPDPYVRSEQTVKAPPKSFRTRLRFLGPGFILSASIVGSGELIATTRLGAEAGWVTLWVILVSCLVKVAVQLEFGRHTIFYGETTMKALSRMPGPRIGRTHWSIMTWTGGAYGRQAIAGRGHRRRNSSCTASSVASGPSMGVVLWDSIRSLADHLSGAL